MINKKNILMILLFGILLSAGFISGYLISTTQYSQYSPTTTTTTTSQFDKSICTQGQDFLVQVTPFGCTPTVVRSDLLEDTDVPVYCQLGATKINPLIDVSSIDTISFSGSYPKEVAGVGFHPAQAALGVKSALNSPVLNNIGYVVVLLKKQSNSSAIPDYVSGNLTATIKYNINKAFGIGQALFYLPEITNEQDWQSQRYKTSFWNGKGYVRANAIEKNSAEVSVYSGDTVISTVNLNKGETSNSIYLPGFDCQAGLKLQLTDLVNPDTKAQLNINSQIIEVGNGEKFLDNKCTVTDLSKGGLSQKVSFRCSEDSGTTSSTLTISPKINLLIDGVANNYSVGDYLYNDGTNRVYLAYINTKGSTTSSNGLYAYLISSPIITSDKLSNTEISFLNSLIGGLIETGSPSAQGINAISNAVKQTSGNAVGLFLSLAQGENLGRVDANANTWKTFGKSVLVLGFADAQDISLTDNLKALYDNSNNDFSALQKSYATQPYGSDSTSSFGEEALYNQILLAYDAGQKKTAYDLCKQFQQDYPNSRKIIDQCTNLMKLANNDGDSAYVTINNQVMQISLNGIYEPTFGDYGVEVLVSQKNGPSKYFDLTKDKIIYINNGQIQTTSTGIVSGTSGGGGGGGGGSSWGDTTSTSSSTPTTLFSSDAYIKLVSTDETSAQVDTNLKVYGIANGIQQQLISGTITLAMNTPKDLGDGYSLTLTRINLKKLAKVSVIPNIDNSGTTANFSFKIGIEKRAISLSPDEIRSTIKSLNDTIGQWQGISNSLGNVTQILKTTCLAVGLTLTAKNFLMNAGGTGIARQEVMKGKGGWDQQCVDLVNQKVYATQDECYSKNADQIDKDVNELTNIINQQNSNIKTLEAGVTTQQILTDKTVDTNAFMQGYTPEVNSYVQQNLPDPVTNPNGQGSVSKSEVLSLITYQNYADHKFTVDQLKNIDLYSRVLTDSSASEYLKKIATAELYSTFSDLKTVAKDSQQISTWSGGLGIDSSKIVSLETDKNVKKLEYTGTTNKDLGSKQISGFTDNTPVALVQTFPDGKQYILVLDSSSGTSKLPIKTFVNEHNQQQLAIYDSNGIIVSSPPKDLVNVYFEKYDSSSYKNSYKNAKLQYYEDDPYKGMPAVVPFDLQNGWYAATKQTITSSGSATQSYEASGRVNSFFVCNVGANGLEEFQLSNGDDVCEMINTGTGQTYSEFPGLSQTDSKAVVDKAVQAIEQASKAYKAGISGKVKILNNYVDVGAPATSTPQLQCQDYMSPKDCLLLFNVCDPVICPSSRCDLGGAYPVKDVVQTGIIGSTLLCLPNAREGILMPVCLTGIKAGIDNLLSVQKSYRDCLQESLDTGKTVGICDEIYSIYLCDFFWRQAVPFADLVIPKIVEFLSGQNVRGGGEYLTISSAWSAAQQSIDYLTNSYASNAKQAFLSRVSTGDIGTDICKAYASATYPSGANILDQLTQPDSPPQYTGNFDEISLTTATNPPTSQYKVFYHIYAGQDTGAYFQVYLKGSPTSSYYQDTLQSVAVASGYVPVGGYATDTPDIIATSGYTKLCINVNGQEDCGFKTVSSSFAVNYIKDKVVSSEAANTQIQTSDACISGYNNGIIRICATDNPGKGTDPYAGTNNSRWQIVGYCDDQKMKCWIDTQSISNAIKTNTVANETLSDVTNNYLNLLANESGYMSRDNFSSALQEINSKDDSTKIAYIKNIFDKVFWTDEKAQLLLIRGTAYSNLFKALFAKQQPATSSQTSSTTNASPTSTTTALTTSGDVIWAAAKKLVDSGWNEHRTSVGCQGDPDQYLCIYGNVCSRFVVHAMINAGVDIFLGSKSSNACSQNICTFDSSGNMVFNMDSHSDWEGISNLIPTMLNSGEFTEVNANNLIRGDIVVLGEGDIKIQHLVIFDSYSSDKTRFNAFGDPGMSGPTTLQNFPVSTTTWYIYRAFRYSGTPTGSTTTVTSTTQTTTTSTTIETANQKIYDEATKLNGALQSSTQFVGMALTNAGVSGISGSSLSSLISSIASNGNFVEVNVDINTLQAGDVLLLADGCTKDDIGIFSVSSPQNNNQISFYNSNGNNVRLQSTTFSSGFQDGTYIYKAYRYVPGTIPSDKIQRAKWTIDSALTQVATLSGSYSSNKAFVDQLISDGILTQSECVQVTGSGTGLFGLFKSEGDMLGLRKILLGKKTSGAQAQSVD